MSDFNPFAAAGMVSQGVGNLSEGISDALRKKKEAEAQLAGATFGFNTLKNAGVISHEEETDFLKGNANQRNAIVMSATPRLMQKMQQQRQDWEQQKWKTEMQLRTALVNQGPRIDPATGMMWNGRQWVKSPMAARAESPDAVNKDLKAATGRDWSDWTGLLESNSPNLTSRGTLLYGQFPTNQKDAKGQPIMRTHVLPAQVYANARRRMEKLTGGQITTQPQDPGSIAPQQPAAPPQPNQTNQESKQLDKATAMSILEEVHGDKNKAREIARQRGYIF